MKDKLLKLVKKKLNDKNNYSNPKTISKISYGHKFKPNVFGANEYESVTRFSYHPYSVHLRGNILSKDIDSIKEEIERKLKISFDDIHFYELGFDIHLLDNDITDNIKIRAKINSKSEPDVVVWRKKGFFTDKIKTVEYVLTTSRLTHSIQLGKIILEISAEEYNGLMEMYDKNKKKFEEERYETFIDNQLKQY